jgi:nicotinamidase-related amidase
MLLNANDSCLIQIDVQEKLVPFIHMHEELVLQCRWMLDVAALLEIPTVITEQYPQGLGHTVAALREDGIALSKTQFSCSENEECLKVIRQLNRNQVVLIGIETHVCVLQTAFGLQQAGKEVFIVADATESRRMQDKVLAIDRMQAAGIQIISAEMALFEWCRDSKHPKFKELSKRFLQKK